MTVSTNDALPLCAWCGDEIWDETPEHADSGGRRVPIHGACRHPWRKRGWPDISDRSYPGRGEG